MAVHIDQLTSEVIPETETTTKTSGETTRWEELDRLRELQLQLLWNRLRTAAEGYDD